MPYKVRERFPNGALCMSYIVQKYISTYTNTKMSVCVSVCTIFLSLSKPIEKPFGTKLLYGPGKVLNNNL